VPTQQFGRAGPVLAPRRRHLDASPLRRRTYGALACVSQRIAAARSTARPPSTPPRNEQNGTSRDAGCQSAARRRAAPDGPGRPRNHHEPTAAAALAFEHDRSTVQHSASPSTITRQGRPFRDILSKTSWIAASTLESGTRQGAPRLPPRTAPLRQHVAGDLGTATARNCRRGVLFAHATRKARTSRERLPSETSDTARHKQGECSCT